MADLQIALSWNAGPYGSRLESDDAVQGLMNAYRALPKHIARKHLMAAMRKILKRGVPMLRQNTPPIGTRRGRRRNGERARPTGELRRSVTVRTGQTNRNTDWDAFVWGVLGYKKGFQSRKAIWLEYGTRGGIAPVKMLYKSMQQFGPIAASELAANMAVGLEKAAKEIAGGRNPGRQ